MSSGFFAGPIPPWAYVVGGCLGIGLVLIGMWAGYGRGFKHAEEEQRWAREQAKARREPAPASASSGMQQVHEDQALALANEELLHEWHDHPPLKYGDEAVPGCPSCEARWETVLEPTAVLRPEEMSWTGEIQRMTAAFEEDMARIMGGTDQQLKEITR